MEMIYLQSTNFTFWSVILCFSVALCLIIAVAIKMWKDTNKKKGVNSYEK